MLCYLTKMVEIVNEDGTPVMNPNKPDEPLTYHINKTIVKYLLGVKELINKRDKDWVVLIDGYEGCLSGDTQIQVSRFKVSRRYNIKKLYELYNKDADKRWDKKEPVYVRSFNGKEIRLHKIKDVLYSGKKQTFLLKLIDGKEIKATASHKFLTKDGWKKLEDLTIVDEIMIDKLNAGKSGRKRIKLYDIQLPVGKNHPYSSVSGRVEVHKLIYEARLNNLEFTEYLDILLNEPKRCKELKFIDTAKFDIHHKDGNHYNNSIDNLEQIKTEDHLKYHSNNNYSNFSQGIPSFVQVKNIVPLEVEDVYDIGCEEPHHNFVANGIVVHNSGKSTLGQQLGKLVDPTLDLSRICMTADEFKQAIMNAKKGQCVIYDEAVTGLTSGDSVSRIGKLLKSMMMQMRQKNLFVIVILPTVFELNAYAALSRAKFLFHTYEVGGKPGFYVGYNRRLLKPLYLRGKKKREYCVKSYLQGRFYGKYTVDEELYRKKKEQTLFLLDEPEKKESWTDKKYKQFHKNVIISQWESGKTYQEIKNYCDSIGNPTSLSEIGRTILDYKEKTGKMPDFSPPQPHNNNNNMVYSEKINVTRPESVIQGINMASY